MDTKLSEELANMLTSKAKYWALYKPKKFINFYRNNISNVEEMETIKGKAEEWLADDKELRQCIKKSYEKKGGFKFMWEEEKVPTEIMEKASKNILKADEILEELRKHEKLPEKEKVKDTSNLINNLNININCIKKWMREIQNKNLSSSKWTECILDLMETMIEANKRWWYGKMELDDVEIAVQETYDELNGRIDLIDGEIESKEVEIEKKFTNKLKKTEDLDWLIDSTKEEKIHLEINTPKVRNYKTRPSGDMSSGYTNTGHTITTSSENIEMKVERVREEEEEEEKVMEEKLLGAGKIDKNTTNGVLWKQTFNRRTTIKEKRDVKDDDLKDPLFRTANGIWSDNDQVLNLKQLAEVVTEVVKKLFVGAPCRRCLEYGHVAWKCTSGVRCLRCKKEGHSDNNCEVDCMECNKKHKIWECKENPCKHCKKTGHNPDECRSLAKAYRPKNMENVRGYNQGRGGFGNRGRGNRGSRGNRGNRGGYQGYQGYQGNQGYRGKGTKYEWSARW
jgi:hypothetical protein